MTIRFLMTTPSQAPGVPFQAGQTIEVTGLTPELRRWLKDGRAEVVREAQSEAAVVETAERAVTRRGKAPAA